MSLINYSENDINRTFARNAYYGTSFSPEKRGDDQIASYVAEMQELVEEFSKWATPENETQLKADLERYRQGYLKRLNAFLSAHSRLVSVNIAGPSNFPVRRQQKLGDIADKRRDEWLEWCKKTLDRMRKTYNPKLASQVISSDDSDAIAKLQAKIDQAEQLQAIMKAANAIIRKRLSDEQKVAELVKLDGISEKSARELLEPGVMGNTGFASFQLTNNNANINRMKARIEELKREQEKAGVAEDVVINGVTVSENTTITRLQLFFPGKPASDVIARLKANGFHWSPQEGAWQRLLNDNARWAAKRVLEQ